MNVNVAIEPAEQARANAEDSIPREVRLGLYKMLVETRACEKRAHDLFLQNLVKGTSHLALGQEAVAAGVSQAMRPDDYAFLTFRGHHHAVARGMSMTSVLGELMGRQCGAMAGKGGSMHLASAAHNVMASYAILGSQLTIANGAAWSAQYRGTDQVSISFFGDGTANIGAFHEALNLAAIWKLPVIFVCENNIYMEYTRTEDVTPVKYPAADRAASYGLEHIVIDGNDADVVYLTAKRVIERARAGEGPAIIECLTYRLSGHSRADPAKYRPEGELDEWVLRDPVTSYRKRLLNLGVTETELTKIESDAEASVELATETAKASATPAIETAFTDVWADGGNAWRN
jgi:acetoin:2,6-dichlorophenolindophenol oxidoreductase subunit alpha